jgi:hypothetical protein
MNYFASDLKVVGTFLSAPTAWTARAAFGADYLCPACYGAR